MVDIASLLMRGCSALQSRLCVALAMMACRGQPAPPASQAQGTEIAADAPRTEPVSSDDALVGLWQARRSFGPDARGPLVLQRGAKGWTADFMGSERAVRVDRDGVAFELSGEAGAFRGHLAADGRITGHWTSPRSVIHGARFAVPVVLEADGADRWRGQVVPLDDTFTLYLMVEKRSDGSLGVFLRNPDRNIGVRYDVDRLERDGSAIRLLGRPDRDRAGDVLLSGSYDAGREVLTIAIPARGGSYEFRRDGDRSDFYPRGKRPRRYAYVPPPVLDDGWPTSSVDRVGVSRAGIEAFIQTIIDMPIDSVHAPQIEGVLI